MINATNTIVNNNFDKNLSICNSDDEQNDSEFFESSYMFDNLNNSYQEKDNNNFLGLKNITKFQSEDEQIFPDIHKVFSTNRENEENEINQENMFCEKQNSEIFFIEDSISNNFVEKTKKEIKFFQTKIENTETDKISFNVKEKKECEKKEEKTIAEAVKKPMFQVKTLKTPGRKIKKKVDGKSNKKKHTKNDYDNVIRKVQVHYIKFIIKLSNDIISSQFGKNDDFKFKDIRYDFKKQINFSFIEKLKTLSIKEVLLNPVSSKFRKENENEIHNENIYNKVINSAKWLFDFFNMNYLTLFENYYLNKYKPLSQIIFKGKIINLSKNTKSFFELYKESNDESKKLLIESINRAYFGLTDPNIKKFRID